MPSLKRPFQLRLIVAASANASSLLWKTKQVPLIIITTIVAKDLWLPFWHVAWHLWQREGYDNVNIIWIGSIFHLQTKVFRFIFLKQKWFFLVEKKKRFCNMCVCVLRWKLLQNLKTNLWKLLFIFVYYFLLI